MNQLVEYLSSIPSVHKVRALIGSSAASSFVEDFYQYTAVSKISFGFIHPKDREDFEEFLEEWHPKKIDTIPEISVFDAEDPQLTNEITEDTALLFDSVDNLKYLYGWKKLHVHYLVGAMQFAPLSAFEVWEQFRQSADEVYLLTWGAGRKSEALYWKKNPDSDIELSVIFPMYNVAKYLPECIESVTAWNAPYIEFLFVDDGSPDNCGEIISEAAKKDPRIKLLTKTNGGCASARQYGLERAKGRYIGFIDPDDYIDPTMYRKLLRRAFLGTYDVSYSGYKELYDELSETRNIPDLIGSPYVEGTTDRAAILKLMTYLRVAIWRGIYRREFIESNNLHFYTELRRFDDLPFKVEVFATAKSVACVPEYLYYYRMGRPGQDVSANDERLYVHFPIFAHLDEFSRKNGSKEIIELLQIVKLSTHIYAIEKLLPQYVKGYVRQAHKDILHNVGFMENLLIYRQGVSKRQRAFFFAIMLNNAALVRRLCNKDAQTAKKRDKLKEQQIRKLEELSV